MHTTTGFSIQIYAAHAESIIKSCLIHEIAIVFNLQCEHSIPREMGFVSLLLTLNYHLSNFHFMLMKLVAAESILCRKQKRRSATDVITNKTYLYETQTTALYLWNTGGFVRGFYVCSHI